MKDTYFGFTDKLKPMQAAKTEKLLDKLTRYDDNKVGTNKEFVFLKLQEGYIPDLQENYSKYSARTESQTKPRTLYKLSQPNDSYFYEINKTLHGFALHLIENDFLDEQKASAFIAKENEEKEKSLKQALEQEQKERTEKQRLNEIENQKRKEEVERKQKEWLEIGRNIIEYFDTNPITSVLDIHWKELRSMYEEFEVYCDDVYIQHVDKLTMMLGNKELCIHRLQYFVECENKPDRSFTLKGNPTMFIEKEVLFKTFQPLLTDKPATLTAKINAVFKGRKYNKSKPVNTETFYHYNGEQFIPCESHPIKIEGITFFIIKAKESWCLYEARSGRGTLSANSKTTLLEKAKESIKRNKSRLQSSIEYAISQSGLSPKYIEKTKTDPLIRFNQEGQGVLF
ncbi:hypothetical protein QTG56_23520 (plasmid) [Rossellomorea sp. AcN35-11]|nr:hypothetical protein [Rossellomorea aquimaris]WJV32334.1 hypothetical protein QTG56_23520 [Rossellomorea sp. AcN35-11]